MRLVHFKRYDIHEDEVWINPDQVVAVEPREGYCSITFINDSVAVVGSRTEVVSKLAEEWH